jgi:hypothetical protein
MRAPVKYTKILIILPDFSSVWWKFLMFAKALSESFAENFIGKL